MDNASPMHSAAELEMRAARVADPGIGSSLLNVVMLAETHLGNKTSKPNSQLHASCAK